MSNVMNEAFIEAPTAERIFGIVLNTNYSDIRDDILKSCPLLFGDKQFGFECGDGWLYELKDLCYRLELYNQLVYPRSRVRISAED